MVASLTVLGDGRVQEATPDALAMLGVTLSQLRALPPGAFSPDPADPEADAAFRSAWEAGGRPDLSGEGTLRRPDGSLIRVRFVITPAQGDRFLAVLEEAPSPVDAPPVVYTGGEVVSRWRAAERRLEALDPASDEAAAARAEIDDLRARYQELFRRP